MTGLTKLQYLTFWRIFKILPNYICGPVIRWVCPHNNWLSFIPIFLKLYRDISKIKKILSFLGGGGVTPTRVGGTHLKLGGWGVLIPIISMFIEASLHIVKGWGNLWVGVLTGIDGWGALTPMCLLFDVIYWSRRPRGISAFNVALVLQEMFALYS